MFESAQLPVGIKLRSPSCRNTAPLPMLKLCFSRRINFVQVVLFSRLACCFCIKLYRFTKGSKMGASITLYPDLNSANECQVKAHTQTGWSNTTRSYGPAFHGTRNTDQRCQRGSTDKGSKDKPACHARCQQKRQFELKGPEPTTEDRD